MFGEEKEQEPELPSSSELQPVEKKKIKITFTIDCIEVKTNEVNTGATKIENCTQAEEESARLLNWEDSTASIKIEGCDGDDPPLDLNTIEPLKQFAKEGLSYMYLKNGFISKDTYGLSDFLNAFIENKDDTNAEKREKYLAVAKEIFDNAIKDGADESKPFVKEIKAANAANTSNDNNVSDFISAFTQNSDGDGNLDPKNLQGVPGAKFIQLLYGIVNKGKEASNETPIVQIINKEQIPQGPLPPVNNNNIESDNDLNNDLNNDLDNDNEVAPAPASTPGPGPGPGPAVSAGPDKLVATVLRPTGKPTVIQRRASVQGPALKITQTNGRGAGTSTTIPSAVSRRSSLPPGFGTGRDGPVQPLSRSEAERNKDTMGNILSQTPSTGASTSGGNRTRRYQSKKKRFTRRHNFH